MHQGLADAAAAETEPNLDLQVRELVQAVDDAQEAAKLSAQENVAPVLRQTSDKLLSDLQQQAESASRHATQAAADRAFQAELDDIRLRQSEGGKEFDMPSAHRRYKEVFQRRGLEILTLDPDEVAKLIKASAIRESLIAALDHWAGSMLPSTSFNWTFVAPAVALGGDEASYASYCNLLLERFAKTSDALEAERACRGCLQVPVGIDYAKLPSDFLRRQLDEGRIDAWAAPWGWTTLALLAYRTGDPRATLNCLMKSEKLGSDPFVQLWNVSIRTLALQALHQSDEAQAALDVASEQITSFVKDPSGKNPLDLKITLVLLLQEAEASIGGSRVAAQLKKELKLGDLGLTAEGILARDKFVRIANGSDPVALRRELRTALQAGDLSRLKGLAHSEEGPALSAEMSVWLGGTLRESGAIDDGNVYSASRSNSIRATSG